MERKKLEAKEVLKNSLVFIKEQLQNKSMLLVNIKSILAIIGIVLIFILLSIFTKLMTSLFSISSLKYVLNFLILFLFIFVSVKILKILISFGNAVMLNSLDVALHRPMRKFEQGDDRLGVIGLLLICTIATILGLVFFIVPGVYFVVRASMSYSIYLEEKCSPVEAIKKSFEMTKDNFWPLLIPVSISLIIDFVPIINIINRLFVPINVWNIASVYAQLKNR